MYAWQFAKLQYTAALRGRTRFVSMQNQYNLLRRQEERELLPMCADMGVGVVPYFPQGKGRLARPWGEQSHRSTVDDVVKSFDSPLDEPVVNAVQQVAAARGVSMAQVALAWVLHNPVISAPIIGATKPHHLTEAVGALELHLAEDEVRAVEKPYTSHGPSWFQGRRSPLLPALTRSVRRGVHAGGTGGCSDRPVTCHGGASCRRVG
jgi:aryl-alcohol dehydrogenase-like predicted oxidoreductase